MCTNQVIMYKSTECVCISYVSNLTDIKWLEAMAIHILFHQTEL